MSIQVSSLLAVARQGLLQAVRPELHSDYARSQLAAVMDILSKLERMADWSSVIQREEREALDATAAAVQVHADSLGLASQMPAATAADDTVEASRDRARQLTDWVFETLPPGAARDEFDKRLREGLRNAVAAERRHVPRTDFSTMTDSKEK